MKALHKLDRIQVRELLDLYNKEYEGEPEPKECKNCARFEIIYGRIPVCHFDVDCDCGTTETGYCPSFEFAHKEATD